MTMILEQHRLAAAEHIARKSIRLQKAGNLLDADRAQNRLCDVMEGSRWPVSLTQNLVEAIGRSNSIAVMIDREIIDFTLGRVKSPA